MKVKFILVGLAVLVGLFFLNRYVDRKKEYIAGVPAAGTPKSGEVREKFTVGFLPVT